MKRIIDEALSKLQVIATKPTATIICGKYEPIERDNGAYDYLVGYIHGLLKAIDLMGEDNGD